MKTALQRQLVTTGWHLLGGVIGLLLLFLAAGIWGHGIENRIHKGEEAHVSDHRAIGRINQALHHAHIALPKRGGDAVQKPSSKGHQQETPSSKGGGGGPGKGGVGGGEGPGGPGHGGSGGAAPPAEHGTNGEPARDNPPPGSESAESHHPELPATVEGAGKEAGEVVEGAGKTAEGAVCGTVEAPGCSK